jgi:hypothetical protein
VYSVNITTPVGVPVLARSGNATYEHQSDCGDGCSIATLSF